MTELRCVNVWRDAVLGEYFLAHDVKHLAVILVHALGCVLPNFVHRVHEARFLAERLEFSLLLGIVDNRAIALALPAVGEFAAAEVHH